MRGADKLLQSVFGTPLLRLITQRALQSSTHVAVALRPEDQGRLQALKGLQVSRLSVSDATEGMAASLRAGANWALDLPVTALMIVLPDMPEITTDDMDALISAQACAPDLPLRACTASGKQGHPVILPRNLLPDMQKLRGDVGARDLLVTHPPRLHALADARALIDLDTPEAWEAWQKTRSNSLSDNS